MPGALDEAHAAADMPRQGGYRREEALARRVLGRCALQRGETSQADEHLSEALALQIDMGAELEADRTRQVRSAIDPR